jgi:hypothetical protein
VCPEFFTISMLSNLDPSWVQLGTWERVTIYHIPLTSGCRQRTTKATKALPCYAMSARIRSYMSLGIVWRIYVGFVVDIDIKILGSMCLLVICCLASILFGEMNILHTRIELVVDVIKGIGAPNCLNIFFNGPRSIEILNNHDSKIATTHV